MLIIKKFVRGMRFSSADLLPPGGAARNDHGPPASRALLFYFLRLPKRAWSAAKKTAHRLLSISYS
jgi:hypothetical protein